MYFSQTTKSQVINLKEISKGYFGKRLFDITLSIISLITLSPLFFLTAFLVYWKLRRPIFFKQKRGGLNGKPFYIYKFRSMINEYDKDGKLLDDKSRLTTFGKLLRNTSLDEIPTFYHVLKGEMSIVGPRPLIYEYVEKYSDEQKKRLIVKPGITGWAQVNGRNLISWEEKFKLDIFYVENQSFFLDLKIVFLTFFKVIKREGATPPNSVTMEKWEGEKT